MILDFLTYNKEIFQRKLHFFQGEIASNHFFKFNNTTAREMCETCSNLTKKDTRVTLWCRSGINIVNFEHILCIVLVLLLLILNYKMSVGRWINFKISLSVSDFVKFIIDLWWCQHNMSGNKMYFQPITKKWQSDCNRWSNVSRFDFWKCKYNHVQFFDDSFMKHMIITVPLDFAFW